MNRNDEYRSLLAELESPPAALETTVDRAMKREKAKQRRRIFGVPAASLAACFLGFVLLVNVFPPFAKACGEIPILRDLAKAVTWSPSLTAAVENDYVQPIGKSQTVNGITATIEYLIVDQKQVNIFYRLNSEKYVGEFEKLVAEPVISCDDKNVAFYVYNHSFGSMDNGELQSITVDFTQGNVPDQLQCTLKAYSFYDYLSKGSTNIGPEYLAEFDFQLEFDPQFTAIGKLYPVNETVVLDDQKITVKNIEVYPTHLRVEVAESKDNTAWLKNLDFYIETEEGLKFKPVSSGVIATGSADSPSMVSYRADSTYFYEAEHLKLVITGAKWQRKDMETTYLNLITGEHGELPDGVEFDHIKKQGDDWSITIRDIPGEDGEMHRAFSDLYLDSAGNRYTVNKFHLAIGKLNKDGSVQCYYTYVILKNYPYDEVWLTPLLSSIWTAEKPVEILIQ